MLEELYFVSFELGKVKGSGHYRKRILIDDIFKIRFYISEQVFLDGH